MTAGKQLNGCFTIESTARANNAILNVLLHGIDGEV